MNFEQKRETITSALQEKLNAIKTKEEYKDRLQAEVTTFNGVMSTLLKPTYMIIEKQDGNVVHVDIADRMHENSVFSLYNYTIEPKGLTINTSGYATDPNKIIEVLCIYVFTEARVKNMLGYLE